MPKLHQNVFYYYRGQHSIEKDIETQLENNTTKAFVNVLENVSFDAQKELLEKLIGFSISKKIKKINFILQETTIGKQRIHNIKNRFLLAVSPLGKIEDRGHDYKNSSIPDAWIWCNDFVILIENKTSGELDSYQLDRHKKILTDCKLIVKSWIKDIYPWIKIFEHTDLSPKDVFLIREFRKYLEMVQLSDFEGFDKEDFMRARSEDSDERNYVRTKFIKLGDIVANELTKRGLIHSHNCPNPNEWWDYFVRRKDKPYYTLAHFSIFNSDRFASEAYMIGLKLHLQTGQDLSNLRKKIKSDPNHFKKIVEKLKNSRYSYLIIVTERESYRPYKTEEGAAYSIYSKYITDERVEKLIQLLLSPNKKIWFSVYFTFSEIDAEKLGKKIDEEILKIIDDWWELYNFIIN